MSLTRLHKYCELVTTSNGREEGETVINTDTRPTELRVEQNNPTLPLSETNSVRFIRKYADILER